MKSKLGAHIDIVTYHGQVDKIIQCGMKIVKVIHSLDVLQRIHTAHGNTVTLIARDWTVGDNFLGFGGHLNPKAKAKEWFDRMLPSIQAAPFAFWESFNEMDNWTYLPHYGEFEAERQRIMADNGYRCCIGNFAVGGPPIIDPFDLWPSFYPALESAHQHRNLLGLHEYGALWVDTYYGPNSLPAMQAGQRVPLPEIYAEGWLFGLYRRVWNKHIKPQGWTDLRIAITEMGLMSAAPAEISALAGYPVGSWRTCGPAWSKLDGRSDPEQYYFEQLQWMDRQLQADPYVAGGTIFTWGTFPESAWMRDEIEGPVADKLVNYISTTVDNPEPRNERMYITGIDVSRYQGNALDWGRIEDAGHKFAFLRYSVGDGSDNTGKDSTFDRNLSEIRKTGMLVGAYHYLWSVNIPQQVEIFAQLDPTLLDLPMAVDVEQTNISEANLKLFLSEIKRITGRKPIIYTRQNILDNLAGATANKDWLKDYDFWLAEYPAVVGNYPTRLPLGVSTWQFWQFTSTGSVPGHVGNIDVNYFNGSLEDLRCRHAYPKPAELVLEWPVDSPVVTQAFGANPAHYAQFGLLGHEGVDFRAPTGTNVYSMTEGVVKEVSSSTSYGNYVRIDTQQGYEFTYAHLQSARVSVGQRVFAKQLIGLANNTGNSSGSHLHVTGYTTSPNMAALSGYPKGIFNFTSYLKPHTPDPTGVSMRNKSNLILNIRAEPDVASADIGDIPVGAAVLAYPPSINEYLKILYEDITGYALAKHFEPVADQAVRLRSVAQPYVNIRSGPGTAYADIGDLYYGAEIMGFPVLGQAFWKVIYNNAEAWIASQYLEIVV